MEKAALAGQPLLLLDAPIYILFKASNPLP